MAQAIYLEELPYVVQNKTIFFFPDSPLPYASTITVTIKNTISDLAGNTLTGDVIWSFTSEADSTPPTVYSTMPVTASIDVPTNTSITVTFSEAMASSSFAGNILVDSGSGPASGSINYDSASNSVTFTPTGGLDTGANYTVTLVSGSGGITDASGVPLAADYIFTFVTGAVSDLTPPSVVASQPSSDATNVLLNTNISVSFSEAMNPLTLNSSSFTVTGPGAVSGSILYDGHRSKRSLFP